MMFYVGIYVNLHYTNLIGWRKVPKSFFKIPSPDHRLYDELVSTLAKGCPGCCFQPLPL